jgi:hypothetical protein
VGRLETGKDRWKAAGERRRQCPSALTIRHASQAIVLVHLSVGCCPSAARRPSSGPGTVLQSAVTGSRDRTPSSAPILAESGQRGKRSPRRPKRRTGRQALRGANRDGSTTGVTARSAIKPVGYAVGLFRREPCGGQRMSVRPSRPRVCDELRAPAFSRCA